jgi:LPS-assembly lipoprotein
MHRLLTIAAALVLTACGFQLRGAYTLPFDTLFISLPTSSELHAALRRSVEGSTQTRIADEPKSAQAILSILGDSQAKNILSLNSAGRVREFQLVRTVSFRVHDGAGRNLLPPGQVVIRREITFNDTQVLSKEAEEALLWRDIQTDLVQQLMRRLAASRAKPIEDS